MRRGAPINPQIGFEEFLRVRAQILEQANHHRGPAEQIEPALKMERVAVLVLDLRVALERALEREVADERIVPQHLVVRVRALDRVAQRHDDPASGNIPRDPRCGFGGVKVRGAEFAHRPAGRASAEMRRVPSKAPVVIALEELGLLDSGREADVPLEHRIEPGGRGAAGTDSDKVGKPESGGIGRRFGSRSHMRVRTAAPLRFARGPVCYFGINFRTAANS